MDIEKITGYQRPEPCKFRTGEKTTMVSGREGLVLKVPGTVLASVFWGIQFCEIEDVIDLLEDMGGQHMDLLPDCVTLAMALKAVLPEEFIRHLESGPPPAHVIEAGWHPEEEHSVRNQWLLEPENSWMHENYEVVIIGGALPLIYWMDRLRTLLAILKVRYPGYITPEGQPINPPVTVIEHADGDNISEVVTAMQPVLVERLASRIHKTPEYECFVNFKKIQVHLALLDAQTEDIEESFHGEIALDDEPHALPSQIVDIIKETVDKMKRDNPHTEGITLIGIKAKKPRSGSPDANSVAHGYYLKEPPEGYMN